MKRVLTLLVAVCMVLALAGCTLEFPIGSFEPTISERHPITPPDASAVGKPERPSEPSEEIPEEPVDTPEPDPEPAPDGYHFGTPLAQTEVAEDTYFDNAVFLGDSRTEGLQLFGKLYRGDYYWARGMNVFLVDNPKYHTFEVDGETVTMIGALAKKSYDAVYIMIGINELGCAPSEYERGLREFLDKVLAVQPEAVIYLQTLPPINEAQARESGLGDYINNSNVNRFNEIIVNMAAEKQVVLLDVAEIYRGENGELPADMSADGCHFNLDGYVQWVDYLRCHIMDSDEYHSLRTEIPVTISEPEEEESAPPVVPGSVSATMSEQRTSEEEEDTQEEIES